MDHVVKHPHLSLLGPLDDAPADLGEPTNALAHDLLQVLWPIDQPLIGPHKRRRGNRRWRPAQSQQMEICGDGEAAYLRPLWEKVLPLIERSEIRK